MLRPVAVFVQVIVCSLLSAKLSGPPPVLVLECFSESLTKQRAFAFPFTLIISILYLAALGADVALAHQVVVLVGRGNDTGLDLHTEREVGGSGIERR